MGKLHSSRQMSTCPILRRPTIDVRASSASPTHHLRSLSTHGRRARRGEARRGSKQACRAFLATKRIYLFASLSLSLSLRFHLSSSSVISLSCTASLALAHRLVVFFFLVCSYFAMKPLESFFQGFVVFTISRN